MDYRPISILPTVAKLCERVRCGQLMEYLSSCNVLCSQQYGFRPGLSTETAMLDAVTYATENMDRGMITSLVTADTSKAFESVEHGRLLEKLGWYGVDSDWFEAWLGGRTQSLRGGTSITDVTHGVVQGSILGPVLFLIFTNDLTEHIPHGRVIMYADDTQFLDTDMPRNVNELKARIEENLAIASDWFTQNSLKINPLKTEMVLIKSRRTSIDPQFSVAFGNTTMKPSPSVKILGVTVDSCLSWEPHISGIVRCCYGLLIMLARTRHRLSTETKRLLIEALVLPHIRYCLSVWGSCTATQRHRVQKALNFGARIVGNVGYRDRVSPILRELGWLRVDDLIREHDVVMMRNLIMADRAPEMLRERIAHRSDVSSRTTRATSDDLLHLPRARTEFCCRSFLCRATGTWNGVPSEIRESATRAFKTALKAHLSKK